MPTRPVQQRIYIDRTDAGRILVGALSAYRGTDPLVLAIPRGGIPVGAIVAAELGGQLDTVLVHKLRAPSSPETAIGAIDELGQCTMSPYIDLISLSAKDLELEKTVQLEMLHRRRIAYAQVRSRLDRENRPIIIVDDGLATGLTMIAALKYVRQGHPQRLIAAVPVAAQESVSAVKAEADDFICPLISKGFQSVGQFYQSFLPISDDRAVEILRLAGGDTQTVRV